MEEVERQLAELPRREIAAKSLENSKLILVKDLDEALELTNAYAPEHLIIETENYMEVGERVINDRFCLLRFINSRECRRLCFRNESHPADQRLCQSL